MSVFAKNKNRAKAKPSEILSDDIKSTNTKQNTSKSKNVSKSRKDDKSREFFFDLFAAVDDVCYRMGRKLTRWFRWSKCLILGLTRETREHISEAFGMSIGRVASALKDASVSFRTGRKKVWSKTKAFFGIFPKRVFPALKRGGFKGMKKEFSACYQEGVSKNKRLLLSAFNVGAPLAAAAVFIIAVAVGFNLNYVLKVEYSEEEVGFVRTEKDYEKAQAEIVDMVAAVDQKTEYTTKGNLKLTVAPKSQVNNSDSLKDKIIQETAGKNNWKEAAAVYVDGKLLVACEDGDALQKTIDGIIQPYREKYKDAKDVRFVKNVEVAAGDNTRLLAPEQVSSTDEALKKINASSQENTTYKVQSGDTWQTIAEDNGTTVTKLKQMNPKLAKKDKLEKGDKVVVSTEKKLLQVEVVKEVTYKESIDYKTDEIKNDAYTVGYRDVKKKGKNGERLVTAEVSYIDGVQSERFVLSSEVLKKPVNEEVVVGTKAVSNSVPSNGGDGSGILRWPAAGYISCGWLGYYEHRAIDIAANHGTPIYAAEAGTVTAAGWSGSGYGMYVIIDHGNGMETLYAHHSAVYVKVGQKVDRGDAIAAMGMTGTATGTHVHFEVHVDGVKRNPMNYLSQ